MPEYNCIVIDDSKSFATSSLIKNFIKRAYENNQMEIRFIHLNPKEEKFVDDQGSIVKDKIISELNTTKYLKQFVHLIICDYELGDNILNGFEIVRILRNELRCRKKILLYSSNIDNVVDKIIQGQKEDIIKKIKDLVNSNISEFCQRDEHLVESILRFLKEESTFSVDKFIEEEFFKYKDYKFKSVYDKFENKTLGEIAEIIANLPEEGDKLKKELIEQLIAYMINLENE